ncbi:hypothetical protein AX14_009090 [Amanita brunnescens Koide BX004]|nr:hypothetical protein AX14_009090 [Amanita brunnescens Koide BX004]
MGGIVGGAVGGGVAAGGAVVGGIMIVTIPGHLQYLWGLLAYMLFGIFLFKSRRLILTVDKDVPPTQISLFLTSKKNISDSSPDGNLTALVWKVFDIGYTQDKFNVGFPHEGAEEDQKIDLTIPSTYKEGATEIGFGTVNDTGQLVTCETFGSAPAILNEAREWISGNGRKRTATIRNEETRRIAVGIDDAIHPFLSVERGAFKKGDNGYEYRAEDDLYLHVFRSINYTGEVI